MRSPGKKKRLVSLLSLILITAWQASCSVVGIHSEEQPNYRVIETDDNKEIRQYQAYIVAKTQVQGEYRQAQRQAFRILAAYIFGENENQQDIAMTAPVTQRPAATSESIAMTAPVLQSGQGQQWSMSFMMPAKYTLDSLPVPKNEQIRFERIPARLMASIQYSWYGSEERNQAMAEQLQQWLETKQQYKPVTAPVYAGYDPPWTIPFFRTNEILIEIEPL